MSTKPTKFSKSPLSIEQMRDLRVFNAHEFYGTETYIQRLADGNARSPLSFACWSVTKRGVDLAPHAWDTTSHKVPTSRHTLDKDLQFAKDFADEKFGPVEWVRGPFSTWASKDFIDQRYRDLRSQLWDIEHAA